MDLKTYLANSMAEALEKVKRDLGREAVILHTRTVKRGGILGLGARHWIEITASRNINVLPAAERRAILGREAGAGGGSQSGGLPTSVRVGMPGGKSLGAPPPANPFADELRQEMGTLREMVRTLLERTATPDTPSRDHEGAVDGGATPPELPEELRESYTLLIQNAVAEEIAREVVAQARERLAQCARHAAATGRAVPGWGQLVPAVLLETVERMLPPAEPVQLLPEGGTRFVALVGPTGVGKTTTVAKLAAHFKLREGKRVGLITIDTYRIAAVEQLRAYADILNIPLEIVLTPEEMAAALGRMAGQDLVLIDTSGRSQRDLPRLRELKAFLDQARQLGGADADPRSNLETHLVLSCTAHPAQLLEVAERFAELGVDRVVFTKLDEAVGLGVILNCARRLKLRLSYLTTGQDVPEDIEVGHRRRIAELVLGRGTAGGTAPPAPTAAPVDVRA